MSWSLHIVIADGRQKTIAEVSILKNTAPLVGGGIRGHLEVQYDKGMTRRGKCKRKRREAER
jgi:hypothetical protein